MCSEMLSSCIMNVITDQPQRYGSIEIIAEDFPMVREEILSCLHGKRSVTGGIQSLGRSKSRATLGRRFLRTKL